MNYMIIEKIAFVCEIVNRLPKNKSEKFLLWSNSFSLCHQGLVLEKYQLYFKASQMFNKANFFRKHLKIP